MLENIFFNFKNLKTKGKYKSASNFSSNYLRIESEPAVVESNFISKVFAHQAQRLTFVPIFKRARPFEIQKLKN